MDVFLRVDINIAAMVMLGIISVIASRRLDLTDPLNQAFLITSLIVLLQLFFETATCVLNGRPEPWVVVVSTALHLGLFAAAPMLTYFWYLMLSRWIVPEEKISRLKYAVMLVPVAVNLVLTLLSPVFGLVFYFDGANVYHRGSYFPLSVAIIYFYFLYAFALILVNRKKGVKEEFALLLIVGILPMIGGLFQSLFYGVLLMWSFAGFSQVVVYIFLQQRMVHIDDLTGAWTRGTFERCLAQKARRKKDDTFGLIILDVDDLKKINDEFGHFEGDYALKTAVELIKSALKKTDILARTGGDEFLIILDCKTEDWIKHVTGNIRAAFRQYNATVNKGYKLDCSIGAELFHSDFSDVDHFMRHVDRLMYENKKNKKLG